MAKTLKCEAWTTQGVVPPVGAHRAVPSLILRCNNIHWELEITSQNNHAACILILKQEELFSAALLTQLGAIFVSN